jgi:hypothetical protein
VHEEQAPQVPPIPQDQPPTGQPAPADSPVAGPEYDPDAFVDLVESPGGYQGRLTQEQFPQDWAARNRRTAGPFDPAGFRRAAREPDAVDYGFALERFDFNDAVGALAAVTKGSRRQNLTVDVALLKDRVRLFLYAKSGTFIETTLRTREEIAQVVDGDPVEFSIELESLQRVAKTVRDDDKTIRFVLDGAARHLEVPEDDGHIRLPVYRADGGLRGAEAPRLTGAVQPLLLCSALRFVGLFARVNLLQEIFSTVEVVGDAMVGGSPAGVGRFEAAGLAGLQLRINAGFVAPLTDALPRLDPADTALFEMTDHHLVADAATCVGIPKWGRSFPKMVFQEIRPACRLRVARPDLLHWAGRFGAAVSRGRAGGAVEFALPDLGAGARLALRALDASWAGRGKAELPCAAASVDEGPPPPAGMRFTVALPLLASAVGHFDAYNADLLPLLTPRGAAYALVARHEGGSGADAFAALAALPALAPPPPGGRRGGQG